MKSFDELPEAARNFLQRVTELTGLPIDYLGVGPDRSQTLERYPEN